MRLLRFLAVAATAVPLGLAPVLAAGPAAAAPRPADWGRAVLGPSDGWAAAGPGTTGGSAADGAHVFVAHSRAELVAALGGDNATNKTDATPKIVYVAGRIDGFEGVPNGCADLADPAYSLPDYLTAYDPAVWGRTNPKGPLEDARVRSVARQTAQTQINVGPNTTIVGLPGATLAELTLMVDGAPNVIIRNLTFRDSHDCFPAWSPNDGADGNWNSQFDNISVRRSQNVWIDHDDFGDGANPDSDQPVYFGRPYQVHDGATDITHTSTYVTVSYNRFDGHDKVMLIGSTDNPAGGDPGRLKVTVHHNLFENVVQRLPRVRYGQVDVYSNVYRASGPDFQYALGVGVQSAIVASGNFFDLDDSIDPATLIHGWGGTAMSEDGTWIRTPHGGVRPISLLAAYNSTHDPDLGTDAGWTPTLRSGPVLPAPATAVLVPLLAGPVG